MLRNRLEAIPDDSPDLSFGNECYTIAFTEKRHRGIYGHQYHFFLEDAVIESGNVACLSNKLSGFTVDGTFSQYVVSYVNHVTPIPKDLESKEAASILCAVSRTLDPSDQKYRLMSSLTRALPYIAPSRTQIPT